MRNIDGVKGVCITEGFTSNLLVSSEEYESRKTSAIVCGRNMFDFLGMTGTSWQEVLQEDARYFYAANAFGELEPAFYSETGL